MRVDLPDGQWAELRDPLKVPERRRRAYLAAVADCAAAGEITGAKMQLADLMGDLLIMCLVEAWSFGDVTVEQIAEFDTGTFDALFRACRPLERQLQPDYGADIDPKALTGGSTPPPTLSSTVTPTFATLSTDGTS